MKTSRCKLVPKTKSETLAMIEAMSPEVRAEVSPVWLDQLHASSEQDPWAHGFSVVERQSGTRVGDCVFKAAPSPDGVVEIAYAIEPEHQGKGYATEAVELLLAFASQDERIKVVRAHTLNATNASARVLTKCGFKNVGEVIDPEDGLVTRWERTELKCSSQTSEP
jgi:[ribosomal protein S5]-alanine N-acetyltransferase